MRSKKKKKKKVGKVSECFGARSQGEKKKRGGT